MGRHAKRRRLGPGQLATIAVAGAVVAGAAGAGIVRMAGQGSEPFEPASSAVTAAPTPAPAPGPAGYGGPAAPPAPGRASPVAPRSAVAAVDGGLVSTRVVAGSTTRTLTGLRPVRWFADGTLLLQGGGGRDETVVYDPAAGRFAARLPYVFGGRGRGLEPASGPGAAPQSFFVPEDLIAGPSAPLDRAPAGPATRPARHHRTLIEVSSRLAESRTQLPAGEPARTYRPGAAVRVGEAVFVPYGSAADVPRGVLRIGAAGPVEILQGRRVERLAVSSDYRHLLALVRAAPAEPAAQEPAAQEPAAAAGDDLTTLRILAVDPDTGKVTRRLLLPAGAGSGRTRVGLIDRAGARYAVQLTRACSRPACAARGTATWRWQAGHWAPVGGTAGAVVLWQSSDGALVWRPPDGEVRFFRDGRRRQLHDNSAPGVSAPGSLLRPAD